MKTIGRMVNIFLMVVFVANFIGCQKEIDIIDNTLNLDTTKLSGVVIKDTVKKGSIEILQPVVVTPPVIKTPTDIAVEKANYYVSTTGSDSNPGTEAQPFKSWTKAWSMAKPGDLIYIRGGVYRIEGKLGDCGINLTGKNGQEGNLIRFWAYPGETPVLNLDDKKATGYHSGLSITANYCHFKGLEICYTPQYTGASSYGVIARDCYKSIFEGFVTHHNQGRGFLLTGKSSYNTILNCDSHHNADPYANDKYGNADGIAVGVIPAGYGKNVVRGCRSWYNSDDGFDTWGNESDVTFENCWAFDNGYIMDNYTKGGDGTGFKMGAAAGPYDGSYKRIVKNCLAVHNRQIGYSQNGGNVAMQYINSTAFKNGLHGYHTKADGIPHFFRNNLDYKNNGSLAINSAAINDHNSWNGVSVKDADFVSLDQSELLKKRKADGSLPDIQFLKPAASSTLFGKAVNIELFAGNTSKNIIGYSQSTW